MGFSFQNAERSAKLSWALALTTLAYSIISNQVLRQFEDNRAIAIANAIIVLALIFSGLFCAIYAYCGMPKQGRRGILIPATIGFVLNGLFLGLVILGIIFFARGSPHGNERWQKVVGVNAMYQVDVMGTVTRNQSSTGQGQDEIIVYKIEAASYNARVLMSAEQIIYTPSHGVFPTDILIAPLIKDTLAHYGATEIERQVIETDDVRTIITGRMTDPPGECILVIRHEKNIVYFLGYMANDSFYDQADADRFLDSFQQFDPPIEY